MNKKILLAVPMLTCILASCVGKKTYPCSSYCIPVQWTKNSDFRILQLSDIHLSQSDIYDLHYKFMDKTISDANADLIVLNGDSFTYADKKLVKSLFSFIDSHNIPWTFAYGNHDDQGYFSDAYIQRLLGKNTPFKNVKFVNLEDDDVTGRSNFAINLYKDNNLKFQVYLLESHSYNFDTFRYDFIKQNQIDWYKRMIEWTNKSYLKNDSWKVGDPTIPSTMYFHIPLPEFFEAWYWAIENGVETIGTDEEFHGGPKPSTDLGFFDVIKEYGSTKAISVAHEHINDSVIDYEGVKLCFGVHSTNRIYFDENKLGGQVIIINKDDQSLSTENIYHKYSEVK